MEEKRSDIKNKIKKRHERLNRLFNVDLCACAGGHRLKCQGLCRKAHTNPKTGEVRCGELYDVNDIIKKNNLRRSERRRKRYREEESNSRLDRHRRRKKIEKDKVYKPYVMEVEKWKDG